MTVAGPAGNALIPCAECGGPISRSANQCPRCKTENPFGVRCNICFEILKASEAAKKAFFAPSEPPSYYHPQCVRDILGEQPSRCVDCGAEIVMAPDHALDVRRYIGFRGTSYYGKEPPCGKCGCSDPLRWKARGTLGQCPRCKLPVLKNDPRAVRGTLVVDDEVSRNAVFHVACSAAWVKANFSRTVWTPDSTDAGNQLPLQIGALALIVIVIALTLMR